MVVYLEFLQRDNNFKLKSLVIDGGMIKNKLFLQMIADLLQIEIMVPKIEEMSLYGALLFGIQKDKNILDLNDLKSYEISRVNYSFQKNSSLQKSYEIWKKLVDKYFLSNQEKK